MTTIPLPTKLEFIQKDGSPFHGQVIVEPCAAGYGTTVGNALRRVLLSSLPGAAITAVSMKGVQHEFSTIPHVKEDVVEILLNLKRVRVKLFQDEPLTMRLSVTGERVVVAGDIEANAQIEVVSKDAHIATITDPEGTLEMELTIERGRGYVPIEDRDTHEKPKIGTIAVDAIYTPIVNVGYRVEHARVGQMTNFDRLILDIETDGTISIEDAVREAGKLLISYFTFIVEGPQVIETPAAITESAPEILAEPTIAEPTIPEPAPAVEPVEESAPSTLRGDSVEPGSPRPELGTKAGQATEKKRGRKKKAEENEDTGTE